MLPKYVEVERDVFQPHSDATVAGWRNEQCLATEQGKHQRAGVTQMVLACWQTPDCRERAPVPVFGKAGPPGKVQVSVRSLEDRRASRQCWFGIKRPASLAGCTFRGWTESGTEPARQGAQCKDWQHERTRAKPLVCSWPPVSVIRCACQADAARAPNSVENWPHRESGAGQSLLKQQTAAWRFGAHVMIAVVFARGVFKNFTRNDCQVLLHLIRRRRAQSSQIQRFYPGTRPQPQYQPCSLR